MYFSHMIALHDCKDNYVYKIFSRNLRYGVFVSSRQGFIGVREKFDRLFLFMEYHYDTGPPFGTVSPEYEICKCPIDNITEDNETLFAWLQKLEDFNPQTEDERNNLWKFLTSMYVSK